jgi:hypothetical protein
MGYSKDDAYVEAALASLHRATHKALKAASLAGRWELENDMSLLLVWVSRLGEAELTRSKRHVPLRGQLTLEGVNASLEEVPSCQFPSQPRPES